MTVNTCFRDSSANVNCCADLNTETSSSADSIGGGSCDGLAEHSVGVGTSVNNPLHVYSPEMTARS